jgi:2-hydroxy-3-oxopropionate reductase
VIDGAKPGTIVVDMSSIDPTVSRTISQKLAEKGIIMLDAPVSGGEPKAIDGTLSIMVGGPQEAFERVRDILAVMGSSAVLVGEIGSGNVTKLANQIIVGLNIAAMSEAMVLAVKSGVDPEKVYRAIRGGLAGSNVLDAKVPLVLQGNFKPGFRIELHIKDLANALAAAHEVGVPLPLTSQVMEIMQALKVQGKAKDDHGGVIQFYETLAGVKVRKQED